MANVMHLPVEDAADEFDCRQCGAHVAVGAVEVFDADADRSYCSLACLALAVAEAVEEEAEEAPGRTCPVCGGSGGGPECFRCPRCGGSGRR